MPLYKVWYKNVDEPLQFSSIGRCSEEEIVLMVLQHEGMAEQLVADRARGDQADRQRPSLAELIKNGGLGSVRYTEDESEMNAIS
jgi:hypothetical protein